MEMPVLKINDDKLVEFCRVNGFTLIDDDTLKKYGMSKNLVYATADNFVGSAVYPSNMPLLIENGVWDKLIKVNNELMQYGKRIVIYDGYRPRAVQKIFWDTYYEEHGFHDETLVANPKKRGTHNIKINAVDIFIENIDGSPIELPSDFDDFDGRANIHYNNCSEEAKSNRKLLIETAKKYGLIVNDDEWWHYIDSRIVKFGMIGNYSRTKLVPKMEHEVFTLSSKGKIKRLVRRFFT